jgi:hypothetical protein
MSAGLSKTCALKLRSSCNEDAHASFGVANAFYTEECLE